MTLAAKIRGQSELVSALKDHHREQQRAQEK